MSSPKTKSMLRLEDLLGAALLLFLIGFCCFQFLDEPSTRGVSYSAFVRAPTPVVEPVEVFPDTSDAATAGIIEDNAAPAATPTEQVRSGSRRECSPEREAELRRLLDACSG